MSEIRIDLDMVPEMRKHFPYRTFNYSTTATTVSSSRGSALSGYLQTPVQWAKELVDAAKERTMFLSVAREITIPDGNASGIINYRKNYLGNASFEASTEEYAAGNEIAWTQVNTNDGVLLTPTWYNYGVALSSKNINTNALDLISYAKEELVYNFETKVDSLISAALQSATAMSNTVAGMQTIFAGDATSAANNIDAGDILTTSMISKARRLLMSNIGYYWTGNAWTKSATAKNAHRPDDTEPFVLFVAPEQSQALVDDPQFTNAAEYGSDDIVLNGEIGKYIGVKVVETTKVPAVAAAGTIVFQGGTVAEDVACHECFLVKARKAVGVGWAKKQSITAFNWPNTNQVRIAQNFALDAKTIYNDAIVRLVVADE